MLIQLLTEARKGRQAQRPARAEKLRARSAIKTADRGPQGRDNRARSAINLRPEDGFLQLVGKATRVTLNGRFSMYGQRRRVHDNLYSEPKLSHADLSNT